MLKKFIYVKKYYKTLLLFFLIVALSFAFIYAKKVYSNPDFGKTFDKKAIAAEQQLLQLKENFSICASLCNTNVRFLQAIVFPELMRYNSIKDGVEAESLRTLYVQFGEEYANFSIGLFQMKPVFASRVEQKAKLLLSDSLNNELQLSYPETNIEAIRAERVNRLMDKEWQMVYLTAFTLICQEIYKSHHFKSKTEELQWYATVYNAGFDKSGKYIQKKLAEADFYLQHNMPGKKFNYASIVAWYYQLQKPLGL